MLRCCAVYITRMSGRRPLAASRHFSFPRVFLPDGQHHLEPVLRRDPPPVLPLPPGGLPVGGDAPHHCPQDSVQRAGGQDVPLGEQVREQRRGIRWRLPPAPARGRSGPGCGPRAVPALPRPTRRRRGCRRPRRPRPVPGPAGAGARAVRRCAPPGARPLPPRCRVRPAVPGPGPPRRCPPPTARPRPAWHAPGRTLSRACRCRRPGSRRRGGGRTRTRSRRRRSPSRLTPSPPGSARTAPARSPDYAAP